MFVDRIPTMLRRAKVVISSTNEYYEVTIDGKQFEVTKQNSEPMKVLFLHWMWTYHKVAAYILLFLHEQKGFEITESERKELRSYC